MMFLKNISNNTHDYSNDNSPNMSCSNIKNLNSSIIDNNENDFKEELHLWAITNNNKS